MFSDTSAALAQVTTKLPSTEQSVTALRAAMIAFQNPSEEMKGLLGALGYASGEAMVDGAMEKLSTQERAKMVAETLQMVGTVAATQYGIQMLRETMFSDPARRQEERKTPAEQARFRAYSVATRANFFGGYDIIFNMLTGARHGGDPATVLLGPSLGLASSTAAKIIGIGGRKDSENTNTHERQTVRSLWDLAAKPVVNAAAATLPQGKIATALIQAYNHPGTREGLVKAVAGPPMKQGGPMRKSSGF
jgi:hypothetical protein